MSGFDMQSFANDVYFDMKKRSDRGLTDDQMTVIAEQEATGNWDNSAFTKALVNANSLYAHDVAEGQIDGKGVEGQLQSYIQQCAATGNEMLTTAVKTLVTAAISEDIQENTVHVPTIHTHARFHLQDALASALNGAFNKGDVGKLQEFATREGDGQSFKMAAMATFGMMQAHIAMNPPQPETQTGLAAQTGGFRPDPN